MTRSEAPIPLGDKRAPDPSGGDMPDFMNFHPGIRFYSRARGGRFIYGSPTYLSVFGEKETDKLKEIATKNPSKFLAVDLTQGGGGTVRLDCNNVAVADEAENILISAGFNKQNT